MLRNEVLTKSSHKLKNERNKYIQAIEQHLISIDLNFFINQMKLRYLKSILQSRSSLLPSYCMLLLLLFPLPFSVTCRRLYDPLCETVCWSVSWSVPIIFFGIYGRFLHYYSNPNAWVCFLCHCPCRPACDLCFLSSGTHQSQRSLNMVITF